MGKNAGQCHHIGLHIHFADAIAANEIEVALMVRKHGGNPAIKSGVGAHPVAVLIVGIIIPRHRRHVLIFINSPNGDITGIENV